MDTPLALFARMTVLGLLLAATASAEPPLAPLRSGDAPAAQVSRPLERVAVHLEANEPGIEFRRGPYVGTTKGSDRGVPFESLCTSPCDTTLPVGMYRMALATLGGPSVREPASILVLGPGTLQGTYTSHFGLRALGLLTLVSGGLIGTVLTIAGAVEPHGDVPLMAGGALLGGASIVLGAVSMTRGDTAEISFVPWTAESGSMRQTRPEAGVHRVGGEPRGASIVVRF